MNRCVFVLAWIAIGLSFIGGCHAGGKAGGRWTTYGEKPMGPGDAVAIGALTGGERNVVVHGTITDVCKVMGCWLVVRDDAGQEMFVLTKDHAFFVPRNATGRNVVVHGWVEKRLVSVDELRHYAEDAHQSAEEIAKITQPETRITMHADSVMIAGSGLDKPASN